MWEALTALGSLLSAVIIAVTVVLAAKQLRAMNAQAGATVEQLHELRRATQFDAARTVLTDFASPQFSAAYRFVHHHLAHHLRDEKFRSEVPLAGLADDAVHQELVLLRSLDRIGSYVRFGLVDRDVVYSSYRSRIINSWHLLRETIAIQRRAIDAHFWENVEFLYNDCIAWARTHDRDIDMAAVYKRLDEATKTVEVP
jgi:hypothetical protein